MPTQSPLQLPSPDNTARIQPEEAENLCRGWQKFRHRLPRLEPVRKPVEDEAEGSETSLHRVFRVEVQKRASSRKASVAAGQAAQGMKHCELQVLGEAQPGCEVTVAGSKNISGSRCNFCSPNASSSAAKWLYLAPSALR